MTAVLTVENLSIRFGGLLAVEAMSFEVRDGEVLSLIGPNGAGKTSAFNAITGYVEPAGGNIAYRGTSLIGRTPNQIAELGVVRTFQKTSVFTGLTVFDNVMIGLHLRSRQTPLAILRCKESGGSVLRSRNPVAQGAFQREGSALAVQLIEVHKIPGEVSGELLEIVEGSPSQHSSPAVMLWTG